MIYNGKVKEEVQESETRRPVKKFRNASIGTGEIATSQAGREGWGSTLEKRNL